MNFYLLPQFDNKLPSNNISLNTNEFEYVINPEKTTTLENTTENTDSDFLDSDKEEEKVNKFYDLKYLGSKFKQTKTREKLNKIKVYLLVKPVVNNGKTSNVAIAINNFEDLGNTSYSRAMTALSSTFLMRTAQDLAGKGFREGRPGNRPFILEHAIAVQTPYETIEEVSLKDLGRGMYDRERMEEEELERQKQKNLGDEALKALDEDALLGGHLGTEVLRSLIDPAEDAAFNWETQMREVAYGHLYYYSSPYEYDYSFLDNTIFTNSRPYPAQPRDEENFNGKFMGFLKNIKNFDFEEQKDDLKVLLTQSERILFKNTTELLSKNIIPVFCDLEEAQNLLVNVLEELTQPFRIIRPIEIAPSTKRIIANIADSLDYIDDSLSLKNYYFLDREPTTLQKIKDLLKKYRLIKAPNISFFSDIYDPRNYQIYGTKMRKSVYESWQLFFDEAEDLGVDYDYRKGPWDDTRCYLSKSDKLLLSTAGEVKIISMGLGDFLEFWNSETIKNGEVLFIPSLKNINHRRLPFNKKNPIDRFYEYQKKFRTVSQSDLDDYEYEIQISSI